MTITSKPQIPAEGIMLTNDFGNSKMYQIACQCGSNDDLIHMNIEADDDGVNVHVWTTVRIPVWKDGWRKRYDIENTFLQDLHWLGIDLANGLWSRIKHTWRLWVTGTLEYESTTILNEQQALNLADTLARSVDDVKTFRADANKKWHQPESNGTKKSVDIDPACCI